MSNTMTRAEMTDALLEADLTFRFDDHFDWWFETILRDGFKGYRHMTDAELAAENTPSAWPVGLSWWPPQTGDLRQK
jgi:hypothetical protein